MRKSVFSQPSIRQKNNKKTSANWDFLQKYVVTTIDMPQKKNRLQDIRIVSVKCKWEIPDNINLE